MPGSDTARRLLLGLLVCLALLADRAPSAQAAPAVPLPHYDLAVQLDVDAASLTAREVLRFSNTYGIALDRLVFKTPAGAVAAYASLVGPYPLTTLRVAETGLQPAFAGMEYPGLVFVSAGVAPRASEAALHGIVAHEIAHQWFYGLIGDDELADPWLDEAFATYLAVEASESMPAQLSGTSGNGLAAAGTGPPVDQSVFDFQDNGRYGAAVYARGARFLAELRRAMGDAVFVNFLRMLYTTYAGKVETPRAVLDLAQQAASTSDLAPLIADYTRYAARSDWSVNAPVGPWSGQVGVDVETPFALSSVELWLDDRQIASGSTGGIVSIDTSPLPAGEYVLLTRVTDLQGAIYERALRVTIAQ